MVSMEVLASFANTALPPRSLRLLVGTPCAKGRPQASLQPLARAHGEVAPFVEEVSSPTTTVLEKERKVPSLLHVTPNLNT